MLICMSCFGSAAGNHQWHGYPVCGNCFAELSAEQLNERIQP